MNTTHLSNFPKVKTASGCAWPNVQELIGIGYRQCTRRTYFVRFEQASAPANQRNDNAAANAAKHFFANGVFDLNQCSPKELMRRLRYLKEQIALQSWPPACGKPAFVGLDIAFTYAGLDKLGVRRDLLEVFRKKTPTFYENAFARAAKQLGDTGYSDPMQWAPIYQKQGGKSMDLVLIAHFSNNASVPSADLSNVLTADTVNLPLVVEFENALLGQLFGELPRTAAEKQAKLPRKTPNAALQVATKELRRSRPVRNLNWVEEAASLGDGRVYFGYKDGLTSPTYTENGHLDGNGAIKKVYGHRTEHALGELLLGYPRNDGDNAYAHLNLVHKASANIDLQAVPEEDTLKCFFKDSTFGVLRKMQQRTKLFEDWVNSSANARSAPVAPDWIKAKILGRCTEGRLLQTTDNPSMLLDKALNTFNRELETGFNEADPQGEGCPFSSHVRRMNPRDDPVSPFIHRPLLRRGMPYTTQTESFGEAEVGLSGLFFCADIAEQFEHLVGIWGNKRVIGVPDASKVRDPIIGNHGGDGDSALKGEFFLNSKANRQRENVLTHFSEPFVITRGCAYLWFPSVTTLDLMPSYFQS